MQLLNPMLRLAADLDRRRQAQLGHAALDSQASELMHLFRPLLSSNPLEARKHGYRLP